MVGCVEGRKDGRRGVVRNESERACCSCCSLECVQRREAQLRRSDCSSTRVHSPHTTRKGGKENARAQDHGHGPKGELSPVRVGAFCLGSQLHVHATERLAIAIAVALVHLAQACATLHPARLIMITRHVSVLNSVRVYARVCGLSFGQCKPVGRLGVIHTWGRTRSGPNARRCDSTHVHRTRNAPNT